DHVGRAVERAVALDAFGQRVGDAVEAPRLTAREHAPGGREDADVPALREHRAELGRDRVAAHVRRPVLHRLRPLEVEPIALLDQRAAPLLRPADAPGADRAGGFALDARPHEAAVDAHGLAAARLVDADDEVDF